MTGRIARLHKALLGSLRAAVATDSSRCAVAGATTLCTYIADTRGGLDKADSTEMVGRRAGGTTVSSGVRVFHTRPFSSLEATAAEPRQVTYYVEVITGDVRGAGTPAPAAITLFGEDGESESHVIGAEETDSGFERATKKTYALYSRDLGQLKRILIQQLPSKSATDNDSSYISNGEAKSGLITKWYLDRIEVKGPDGEQWTFPCGEWLGRDASAHSQTATNGSSGSVVEERNLIPSLPGDRGLGRSSLQDPQHRISHPLTVDVSGIALPHPEKVQIGMKGANKKGYGFGGEDAYFFATNRNGIFAAGIADGVYAWRSVGIDAGTFSRQLMEYCRQAVELGTTDVLRTLQFANRHLRRDGTKGSSTACLVLVDTLAGRLAAANLGDSGFMLLGRRPGALRGAGSGRGQMKVRYRSPQQEHSFGHPYQLGHHGAADVPEDAMLTTMPVYPGDVLVLGSDGLFDNLAEEEIVRIVEDGLFVGQSSSALSHSLCFAAFEASIDRRRTTPYSLAASSAFDMVYDGGKADDITSIVAVLA